MREIVKTEKLTLAQKRFDVAKMAKLLDDAYMATRREPSDRPKKSFAPSGVGYGSGKCARQWFYAFNGGIIREDDNDAVGIANMAYGTEAHERIQGLFERAGILVEAEREIICEDPPIYGYGDLVIKWQGEDCVGEIKTTMQESFVSKKHKMRPAGYHLLQVLLYMWVLDLNKGFLLYENKNMQDLLIIPVTWNDENRKLIEDAIQWMRTVRANWESGELPNRPFTQKSPACKSCPFKTHCWKDGEGTVNIPPLEVPA